MWGAMRKEAAMVAEEAGSREATMAGRTVAVAQSWVEAPKVEAPKVAAVPATSPMQWLGRLPNARKQPAAAQADCRKPTLRGSLGKPT